MHFARSFTRRSACARAIGVLSVSLALAACSDEPSITSPVAPAPVPSSLGKGAAGNSRPILFVSDRETPGRFQIFALNPDDLAVTRLTNSPDNDMLPAWSPDGKRIAFVRSPQDFSDSEIYVINADGTGLTRLTNAPGFDVSPSWSKDGKRIAFASTRAADDPRVNSNDSTDVFVMNADGTGVTRLTFGPRQDGQPAWSPDGRQIAFVSARDLLGGDGVGDVYLMNVDGTQVHRATNFEGAAVQRLSWSPDGREIALSAQVGDGIDVYTVHPDGTQLTRLTFDGQSGLPTWSPDGNLIAFANGHDDPNGNAELFTMRADGTGATRLTITPSADLQPAWFR
jgi:TolB protein